MMSNNSSINHKRYLINSLKSYWWLMLINGIIYFLIGPMLFAMYFNNSRRHDVQTITEIAPQAFYKWFHLSGYMAFYIAAVIIAVIMGLVMYSYLHHKRQINFYHSLPITRGCRFLQQYGLGVVIAILPMLVIMLVMVLMAAVYGGDTGYAFRETIMHLGRILLFFLLSYSITVLAGQMTGTVLTHIVMTGLLQFGLSAIWGCIILICSTFYHTFYGASTLTDTFFSLSPMGYLLMFLERSDSNYDYQAWSSIDGLGWKTIMMMLVLIVAFTAVAYLLYQKRPSEASGMPVIYKPICWPLKIVVIFIMVTLGGFAFLEIGGKGFMVFGIILFAWLTHMTAEVILNKDFKALLKNWKGCTAVIVVLLALTAMIYYDVLGYDRYVPEASEIAAVQINFSNIAEGIPSYQFETMEPYTEPEQIAIIASMLHKVVETESYYKHSLIDEGTQPWLPSEITSTIYVQYTMNNGRQISRCYLNTPVVLYQDEFAQLYNSQAYKRINYLSILDRLKVDEYTMISINSIYQHDVSYAGKEYSYYEFPATEGHSVKRSYSEDILQALKQDIATRDFSSLQHGALFEIRLEWNDTETYSYGQYRYMEISVYAEDEHILAVIDQMEKEGDMEVLTPSKLVERIDYMEVYQLDAQKMQEKSGRYVDLQEGFHLADFAYDETVGTKLAEITDQAEIMALLPNIVTRNQLYQSSAFVFLDYSYVVVAHLKPQADDANQTMVFCFIDGYQPNPL